jgi:hypothetical protein
MEHLTPAHFGLEPYDFRTLTPEEEFWRDHQRWLQDCGYMLRRRYMPDWQPSWPEGVRGSKYEDAQPLNVRPLPRSRLCCCTLRGLHLVCNSHMRRNPYV